MNLDRAALVAELLAWLADVHADREPDARTTRRIAAALARWLVEGGDVAGHLGLGNRRGGRHSTPQALFWRAERKHRLVVLDGAYRDLTPEDDSE